MLTIRPETETDRQAVYKVNALAFGQEDESKLIDALRKTEHFIPELSLVAEQDGRVIGHLLFTKVNIKTQSGDVPAISLAPMAVQPEHQNEGVGSALVRRGLDECRRLGHSIVIVIGHPNYYPRFGFSVAEEKGIRAPWDVPREAFMVIELVPGALQGATGVVEYPPEFEGG
jgi:putative acetyltransferase